MTEKKAPVIVVRKSRLKDPEWGRFRLRAK